MTTELTQPQTELGPDPANGLGQSQGHRRRRRRRKNKSSQASAAPAQQFQAQQPPSQAQQQAQTPQQPRPAKQKPAQPHQGGQPGGRQGGHQNQGRKKKFSQKGSSSAAQPGNSISSPPQGKRKTKQKGPREFVGPMDHSYRIVNGNVADGPPSTIQIMSSGHSDNYLDDYSPLPAVAIRADATTRIYCFIDDLFFLAKIQETARKLGVKVEFVKGDKDSVTRLLDLSEAERPKLVVFDLNNLNAKPMALIPKFKARFKKAVSIVGYLNHLQGELKAKAIEAGCDAVMPRSAFSQSLPTLLRRYGVEEEEDNTPQPM
ncbi:MAG: response regulator [Terracidiphilus sp.]